MSPSIGLTEDILLEIFTYLPLNSVYKFRCLSKVWLSNLSNPNFIIKWFQINYKSMPWVYYHKSTYRDENPLTFKSVNHDLHSEIISRNKQFFSFKFLINKKPLQGAEVCLLGSCNGLVLCYSFSSNYQTRYHVCNPLTQTWVTLPKPPHSLASDQHVHGIFYETSSSFTNCYKVVRIPYFDKPSKKFNVDMFCSGLGVWERFMVSCDENIRWSVDNNVVILNGVLFWIEGGGRILIYKLNQKSKSDGHRCRLISLPDEEFPKSNSRIGESEGSICYARSRSIAGTETKLYVSVWVLNDGSWKILHKDISVGDIYEKLCSRLGEFAPAPIIDVLGFSPADNNVVLLGWKHWVWGFNIKTRSFEDLCSDNRHKDDAGRLFLPFVLKPMPTLLPPPSWNAT